MANLVRNFIKGRMNKSVDERLVPNGEYIDAQNIRMGSTEDSEIGAIENTKGNEQLTTLVYPPTGTALSDQATCLGSYADGANETIYWFVHDPAFTEGDTGKLDLIVSFDATDSVLTYHVVSIDDGGGTNTSLNFDPQYLITGVDFIDNLLFFTDDKNPPRKINVIKGYSQPTAFIDETTLYEDVLVLKRPPNNSPDIFVFNNGQAGQPGPDNYLEERLICFAYRYRYEDGEYSATSQFSAPAFISNPFSFTDEAFLNEGMVNAANACEVTVNTGGPLVVGYDLLFKEMDDNIIRVIQKVDKSDDGVADNAEQTYTFDKSKIYTILPESEILRLYDNVPRLAKAQTVLGNRLVYGNYLEGYDLRDNNNSPVNIDYTVEQTQSEVFARDAVAISVDSSYTYSFPTPNQTPEMVVTLTFDNPPLIQGDIISFQIQTTHDEYIPTTGAPTAQYPESNLTFSHVLDSNYASLSDLVQSPAFQSRVGTLANIETTPADFAGSDLTIWTNAWNSRFPLERTGGTVSPADLTATGVDSGGEPIKIVSFSDTEIVLAFPVASYVGGANTWYNILRVNALSATYASNSPSNSLHSNRGYQVGIVYMDGYGRSSTVLTSPDNEIDIPCLDSVFSNGIRCTIPNSQRPPFWADRYKFVIKQDEAGYESIYSNLYFLFQDDVYFLLEGENAAKVEDGDRYIVKSDRAGAMQSCKYTTVLSKKSLVVDELGGEGSGLPAVAGTYMQVKKTFDITLCDDCVFNFPELSATSTIDSQTYQLQGEFPTLRYAPSNPSLSQILAITPGTTIEMNLSFTRPGGAGGGGDCETRNIEETFTFTATSNYDNIADWFYGQEGVIGAIEGLSVPSGNPNQPEVTIDVLPLYVGPIALSNDALPVDEFVNKFGFGNDGGNIYVRASGTKECNSLLDYAQFSGLGAFIGTNAVEAVFGELTSEGRTSKVTFSMKVVRFNNAGITFETLPQPTLPDLWYESSQSFAITNGFHEGNVQNQAVGQPAIIDTAFFNCISYGNGIESYKIRDSVTGKPILLGNRVTTVSAQDYKEIRRFADLTYSGVINDETNINKLNEFNLGLLNFKPLEDSYGPVEKLFGRRTDILTLQEDKISYVLAGKNLLTDSTGASVVTSVPEVLGTQVARVEDFGISNNPESFAEWGPHKFFTDAKRGSVIHLYGDGQNEQLEVISENGMRSWFRDTFISDFNTQKLGGYDPYMNEYVLASNETQLPEENECFGCGPMQTLSLSSPGINYCVDVGNSVGPVLVEYEVTQASNGETANLSLTYNNVSLPVVNIGDGDSGTLIVPKNVVSAGEIDVNLLFSGTEEFVVNVTVNCVDADDITIRLITLTNNSDAGRKIHNEYQWEDTNYVSPVHSSEIKFLNGDQQRVVSQYDEIDGPQGGALIPTDTSTVTMLYNRFGSDNYILKSSDRFRYLRSNTNYANTSAGIAQLLADIEATGPPPNIITPTGGPAIYTGQFDMDGTYTGTGEYLYLVWDYSSIQPTALCYDATRAEDACCECTCDPANCQEYTIFNNNNPDATVQYTECGGSTAYYTIAGKQTVTICSDSYPTVIDGEAAYVNITLTDCDC